MRKKRLLKRSTGMVLAVCILFALLSVVSPILARKDSKQKFYDFYQHAEDFDVLFFGSSHILNAVVPMDLWNQNGITSYNMGVSGCRMGLSYWMLKNALEYSEPEVIVLDCAYLKDEKVSPNKEYNHGAMDVINHFPTKIKAVFDLFDTTQDRIRYLFPFSLYHNRWNEVTKNDFLPLTPGNKMGFEGLDTVAPAQLPEFSNTAAEDVTTVSVDYLRKIISTCQDRGIQILLTFLPYSMNETSLKDAAFVQELAAEYGVHYLGPERFGEIINPAIDFANDYEDNSHLNLSGAHKVSVFLGNYIQNNYSLQDHRGDAHYAYWNAKHNEFRQKSYEKLDRQTLLEEYLITLSSGNLDIIIEMQSFDALIDSPYVALFQNLGVDVKKISTDTDCIMIRDNIRKVVYYDHFADSEDALDSLLGYITFTVENGENSGYSLNGREVRRFDPNMDDNYVSIVAVDSITKEIVSKKSFSLGGNGISQIVIEQRSGGYWSANEYHPAGEFVAHEECSAKRTEIIPVTPGDRFLYKGNGTSIVHSVVWLDGDQKFISKESYAAEDQAVTITAPEDAAYAWFASFQYTKNPAKVVLEVVWELRQADLVQDKFAVEEQSGGYWSANEYHPAGEFIAHEECSAKRTEIIPVTPGDRFLYKGNGTSIVHSVVWLDGDQKFISKESYAAEDQTVTITAPEDAAYAWFASFQYTQNPAKVVLEVVWELRQTDTAPEQEDSQIPKIAVEEQSRGYWAANEYHPAGEFVAHEECSAKRTEIIPVTPGDRFRYKGNGTSIVHSVVWLDGDQKFISKESYAAEDQAVTITAPDGVAYAWFASFQYTKKPAKVVLEVVWELRQTDTAPEQEDSQIPKIAVEEQSRGYWAADVYHPTGEFVAHEECSAKRTEIVPVTPGDRFLYKGNGTSIVHSVVWLDGDQKFISKESYAAEDQAVTITVPEDAAYAWFASFQYTTNPAKVVLEVAWELCQDTGLRNKLNDKLIVYDGDSVAAGLDGGFAKIVAEMTGSKYINYARGGGHLASHTDGHSVVDNLPNLSKEGNLYCFEGGINDYWANVPIGECIPGDFSGPLDTSTLCGAMESIFRYCRDNLPEKPVCFVIIHKVQKTADEKNGNGDTFTDYHNAMVEVCKKYSVPYYDAFVESGLDGSDEKLNNLYLTGNEMEEPDGIHPNRAAYEIYYVPQIIELFSRML